MFTKLDMINVHGSVAMTFDGCHRLVITSVSVGQFLGKFVVGIHSRSHF